MDELPEVKEVGYVSREEAMKDFKAAFGDNESLMKSLEVVGINPFFASLNVKAFSKDQYGKIADYLNKDSYQELIDHSNYNQTKETIAKVFFHQFRGEDRYVVFECRFGFYSGDDRF